MSVWQTIRPGLVLLDKCANWGYTLVRDQKPVWETNSARWGRERETNLAAKLGCPILDKIDPTTDDHCGDALKAEEERRGTNN
jgi:hypothetical protein